MKSFAISVGYLPSLDYSGFNGQFNDSKNIFTLVVQAITKARIFDKIVNPVIHYASRTDRGVGALHQVVSFQTYKKPILTEINSYLPEKIRVLSSTPVPIEFNPRRDAILRTYSYFLTFKEDIDISLLNQALSILNGTHDFRNFSKNDPKKEIKTIRTLNTTEIYAFGDRTYRIQFTAKSFLWQQIRRIIGHLIDLANGNCELHHTYQLLESTSARSKPSPAPPDGLILDNIQYNNLKFIYNLKSLKAFQNIILEHLLKLRIEKSLYNFLSSQLNSFQSLATK